MNQSSVPVRRVVADPALQPRVDGIDPDHVRALEAVPEAWPPLRVVVQGDGFLLIDGFHRLAAAQNLGLAEVPVEVLDPPADGDLTSLAFAFNVAHGRPLTLADRRAFARRLLHQHPDWSDREIGRRAGLVQPTIAKVRQDLERDAAIAPAETRRGRDGRVYPASPASSSRSIVDVISDVIERATTPAERIQQREIVRHLERLAVMLETLDNLAGFSTIKAGVDACRAVLGEAKARELAERLGWSSGNVLAVAEALGYEAAAS
ncbi:ParB/RepB/Spo0J family partition protein [Acidibrevibacterium fodinaquatile]|uniref:ParB/RepB/Spo0J family partition protein n=1 Tax=Acidibrevibacterium fodinaquatile TaxID=1969806 RepID=UPI0013B4481B|nr:ParB/RepB/Spo0J family partition protein [Acidibrevibacterium fodinaquatile]